MYEIEYDPSAKSNTSFHVGAEILYANLIFFYVK